MEGEWIHGYVWLSPFALCSPQTITLLTGYESVSHSVSKLLATSWACRLCLWDSLGKNTGGSSHSYSRGSSQPRYQTWVSYIAGKVLYHLSHHTPIQNKKFFGFFFVSVPSSFGLFGNLLWAGPDSIHCPALHFCGPCVGFLFSYFLF